jgi:hypothetical protein
MRRISSIAALSLVVLALPAARAQNVDPLAFCQDAVRASLKQGGQPPDLTPEQWESCRARLGDSLEGAEPIYGADPRPYPQHFESARVSNLGPGRLDPFDSTSLLQGSSSVTFKALSNASFATVEPAALPGLARVSELASVLPLGSSVTAMLAPRFRDPMTYNPRRTWEERGAAVNSCTEWVWKRFHEYSRFVDASKACGADSQCVVDLAYARSSVPSIAYRDATLARLGGGLVPSLPLVRGIVPKNGLYGVNRLFLRDQYHALGSQLSAYEKRVLNAGASGGCAQVLPGPYGDVCTPYFDFSVGRWADASPEKKAELRGKLAKIDELLAKKPVYAIAPTTEELNAAKGAGSTVVATYANEWDFHKAMSAGHKAKGPTRAERRAIAERLDFVRGLGAEFVNVTSLVQCRAPELVALPIDIRKQIWTEIIQPEMPTDLGSPSLDRSLRAWAMDSMRGDLIPAKVLVEMVGNASLRPAFLSQTFATPFGLSAAPQQSPAPPAAPAPPAPRPGNGTATAPGLVRVLAPTVANSIAPVSAARLETVEVQTPVATQTPAVVGQTAQGSTDQSSVFEGAKVAPGLVKAPGLARLDLVRLGDALDRRPIQPICSAANTSSPDLKDARAISIRRRAIEVQASLVEFLIDEYDRGEEGCFSDGNWCDWSADDFAGRFTNLLQAEREVEEAECLSMTEGGDINVVPAGYRTVAGLPQWFEIKRKAWAEQLRSMPRTGTGSSTAIGQSFQDDWGVGNEQWFNAGYRYDLGYSIRPTAFVTIKDKRFACSFESEAHASFHAGAGILDAIAAPLCGAIEKSGSTNEYCEIQRRLKHLVDAELRVDATGTGKADSSGGYDLDLRIAGEEIFKGSRRYTAQTAGALNDRKLFEIHEVLASKSLETPRVSATVVVVVVPVTFQAFGELSMEANLDGYASLTPNCDTKKLPEPTLEAFLGFRPQISANAVASAAIGVDGLQAGVRGRISLLQAALPITANASVTPSKVTMKFDAKFTSELLAGSMSAFAEVKVGPFRKRAEKEIAGWRGWQNEVPLWSLDQTIDTGAFTEDLWSSFKAR